MRVNTHSEIALTTPITGGVTAGVAPAMPLSAVVPMGVDGADARQPGPKIALIDVDGLLVNQALSGPIFSGENPVAVFQEKLDVTRADKDVAALVVRINSPGGGVTGCDVMRHLLENYRKSTGRPIIVCLVDVGAGGAYYVATAGDAIVAHPTTLTGGIGVIWNSYNLRDLMAQFNIMPQTIKAGANIDMGSVNQAIPPETRKMLQQMADEYHVRFKQVVQASRPKLDAKDETNFDGRIFTASQAQERGLIDGIGYLDDAVALAKQRAQQPQARVIMYGRATNPAFSTYADRSNAMPTQAPLPLRMPGMERSRLPTFLYLWQPEPTLDR
ncbi:MAG: S49 family peptidase [Planctomycetes bacterium]|nr:S49 family peptidase [Planctomycetota bacterium]